MVAAPPLTASSRVTNQSIDRAVKALLKWKSSNHKTQILSNDEFLYLVLTLNKIRSNFRTPEFPIRIYLPHPLCSPYSPTFRICLFVDDRFSLSSKQKIESEQLPISNVLKLSKFRSDFNSFEEKKKLCDSYDVFLADKTVVPTLPGVIGRCFYKRKKGPVAIELGRSDWKEQIEAACGWATLNLKTGTCCVIKVARASMGRDEIVENVAAAINGVAQVVPKKWKNVRAFHLKFSESLALPIYEMRVKDDDWKVGILENGEGRKRRNAEGEGELASEEDEKERRENGGILGKKRKIRDGGKGLMKKASKVK